MQDLPHSFATKSSVYYKQANTRDMVCTPLIVRHQEIKNSLQITGGRSGAGGGNRQKTIHHLLELRGQLMQRVHSSPLGPDQQLLPGLRRRQSGPKLTVLRL